MGDDVPARGLQQDVAFWVTAGLAILLLALAVRWAFFVQSQGTPDQLFLQAFLPIPALAGLGACLARARDRAWLAPAAAFALALPMALAAWVRPAATDDEECDARGFVPSTVGEALEPYGGALAVVGLVLLVLGLVLLGWRPARAVAPWLTVAGVAQLGAVLAAMTCVGT